MIAAPTRVRPLQDNVLILMDQNKPEGDELVSPGGIVMPSTRNRGTNEALPATVIACGPGHYRDKWLGLNEGTAPDGSRIFVPMSEAIKPGARVLVEGVHAGDKIWSDAGTQYRMVREHNVLAVLETE